MVCYTPPSGKALFRTGWKRPSAFKKTWQVIGLIIYLSIAVYRELTSTIQSLYPSRYFSLPRVSWQIIIPDKVDQEKSKNLLTSVAWDTQPCLPRLPPSQDPDSPGFSYRWIVETLEIQLPRKLHQFCYSAAALSCIFTLKNLIIMPKQGKEQQTGDCFPKVLKSTEMVLRACRNMMRPFFLSDTNSHTWASLLAQWYRVACC